MINQNNSELLEEISEKTDKEIQDKRELQNKYYNDNEFRSNYTGKKPNNIEKYVLIENYDTKLKILSPK